jgi:hypothetical protein
MGQRRTGGFKAGQRRAEDLGHCPIGYSGPKQGIMLRIFHRCKMCRVRALLGNSPRCFSKIFCGTRAVLHHVAVIFHDLFEDT